jgi:hypothetical protein
MERKKIDTIVEAFRKCIRLKEEGMVTGSTSEAPGFSGTADPKGPTAGFDPVKGFIRRKGPQIKLPPGQRKRWKK